MGKSKKFCVLINCFYAKKLQKLGEITVFIQWMLRFYTLWKRHKIFGCEKLVRRLNPTFIWNVFVQKQIDWWREDLDMRTVTHRLITNISWEVTLRNFSPNNIRYIKILRGCKDKTVFTVLSARGDSLLIVTYLHWISWLSSQ